MANNDVVLYRHVGDTGPVTPIPLTDDDGVARDFTDAISAELYIVETNTVVPIEIADPPASGIVLVSFRNDGETIDLAEPGTYHATIRINFGDSNPQESYPGHGYFTIIVQE